jgi:signal transduction histidine kinase
MPDGARHAVEVIERNAASQRQIIEDLLDVSRIVAGKLRISTQPVDLPVDYSRGDRRCSAGGRKRRRLRSLLT